MCQLSCTSDQNTYIEANSNVIQYNIPYIKLCFDALTWIISELLGHEVGEITIWSPAEYDGSAQNYTGGAH